jgi:hypothetical protein
MGDMSEVLSEDEFDVDLALMRRDKKKWLEGWRERYLTGWRGLKITPEIGNPEL